MTDYNIFDQTRNLTFHNLYVAWMGLYPEMEYEEFFNRLQAGKLRKSLVYSCHINPWIQDRNAERGTFGGTKCMCIETGQIFESLKDAAKWVGASRPAVSYSCNSDGLLAVKGKHFLRVMEET